MMSPESLAAADDNICRWFEDSFGGTVVELARQPRWRPVWFATVDRNGVRHELVVRGDRTDMPLIFPLEHEMTFQRLLGQHGIPVAAVHGWIDEPMAYVMDRVSGQEHFPDTSDDERESAVDDYLAILARLHSLPIRPFLAAGIEAADDRAGAGLVGLRRYEDHYRSLKAHPDPFLEQFVLADTTGEHDEALVRLFHRRNLRAHMLLGPPGSAMSHHHAIQPFD